MSKPSEKELEKLILRYRKLTEQEKRAYNEEQTKAHFIRPLFEALGWNFEDDVWPETDVSGKRVDYAFKVGGISKFYCEAKPLKADLNDEQYARQAVNYAWNKGVPWAVLTDFESVKVFNALAESRLLQDKLVFEITWDHFLEDFERLSLLSRKSFAQNALESYAIKYGKKLKRLTVNEKLFADLKEAREDITKGFAGWDKMLGQVLLEEGAQKILDRLVFIRVLEDRKLEDSILLPVLREWEKNKSQQFFQMLVRKFRELDETYNSNLFVPHACEKWEEYSIDWKKIFNLLSGTQVYQYDFAHIPADILGGVYESYLSYIARNPVVAKLDNKKGTLLTAESKGDMREKSRKKRKEQGIYYTPHYIVDFIVRHTLGEKLKAMRTIGELKKLKVLDPACGSGSFLTAALKAINDQYRDFGNPANQYTKSEIVLSNIYGVDLDPQAVELARLNLLIETLDRKGKLPLTPHVRAGNSLISGGEKELKKYFGEEWRDKKPFNWQEELPEVFKQGGFDVIIGNPPWGANIDKEAEYFSEHYPQSTKAHKDTYKLFIDKALSLLKPEGILGFIVPNSFLYQPRYQDIKDLLAQYDHYSLNLGEKIFNGVELPSCILIVSKKKGMCRFIEDMMRIGRDALSGVVADFDPAHALQGENVKQGIFKKTDVTFDNVLLMKDAGINYQAVNIGKAAKGSSKLSGHLLYEGKQEEGADIEFWKGSHIDRYFIQASTEHFVRTNFKKFIQSNERVILNKEFFSIYPKLIWRQTASSIIAAMDEQGIWFGRSIIGAVVREEYRKKADIYYALAIFNSKYIDFLYHQRVLETGRVFPQVKLKYLRDLPFVIGNKKQQAEIVVMARKMIVLNKELRALPERTDKWQALKHEIERLDKQIDERVYLLYGLTAEEIKIIES